MEEKETNSNLKEEIENENLNEVESDFADEIKVEEPVIETTNEEETKKVDEQPEVNLYKEEEDVVNEENNAVEENKDKDLDKKDDKKIEKTYSDETLAAIEDARRDFHIKYKKESIVKWIVTGTSLALIVAGYLVPNLVPGLKELSYSMYITLGVMAVALVALGLYSFFSKKKINKSMDEYFGKFYELSNKYSFANLGISNLEGSVKNKISPEDLIACNLYKDVVKVGSRDLISFTYHDNKIQVVDCAAQTKGQKSLVTVFVGKMIVAPNTYAGEDTIIYLKGNKRALPPTNLDGLDVLEDHKDYVIYGKKNSRKKVSKKSIEAIKALHTDKTLIDVAVSIRPGNTYFLMGYEDNLMVLPLEKPFEGEPSEHYREDLKKVFKAIDAINAYKEKE